MLNHVSFTTELAKRDRYAHGRVYFKRCGLLVPEAERSLGLQAGWFERLSEFPPPDRMYSRVEA